MGGTLAYMPVAMRKVMPYCTFAVRVTEMTAYPMMAMGRVNSMMVPRTLRRSDRSATTTVQIEATAYGITVHNWASFGSVAKLPLMMDGRKRPKEYNPERMAKYADAESQTWTLKTPRLTSDQANLSVSCVLEMSAVIYGSHGKHSRQMAKSILCKVSLVLLQESGRLNTVRQRQPADNSTSDCDETFDDKDPAPSLKAASWSNSTQPASKQTTKGTRQRRSGVEDADT